MLAGRGVFGRGGGKESLKLAVVKVAQLWELTKSHSTVYFKGVNVRVSEFCIRKAVTGDEGYPQHDEHEATCGNVESLYCTPETNRTPYVNYTGVKIKKKMKLLH